jgi:hypothetical protein
MAECFDRGSGDDVPDIPLELNADIVLDPTHTVLQSS